MRLSRVTLIILGVVVLGVAFGYLYMMYSRQLDEQAQLKAKIAANQATVAKLVAERETVQAQLAKLNEQLEQKRASVAPAQAALEAAKSVWPKDAESIEYDEQIFNLASGWKLNINVVQAGEPSAKAVQGIGFLSTAFDVSIMGEPLTSGFEEASDYQDYVYQVVGNILGFIDALASDKSFASASIDIVNITVPPLLSSEEVVAGGTELPQPQARLSVTVYTYRGG